MKSNEYDCVVVGAGPAGSNAAYNVAKEGFKTLLIERDHSPGWFNSCGGGIGYFLQELYGFPDDIAGRNIYKIDLQLWNRTKVFEANNPLFTSIQRPKFDKWFAERAVGAGAELKVSHKALDYDPYHKVLTCLNRETSEKVQFNGKLFIFADGPKTLAWQACRVGLPPTAPCHFGVAMELTLPDAPHDKYEFIFDEVRLPYGYYWVFPRENALNVGLGGPVRQLQGSIGKRLKDFINAREDLRELKSERTTSGLIPAYLTDKLHGDSVMVVGDSGGFVNPITGGGIFLGLKSAEMAAKTACEALKMGTTDSHHLARYSRRVKYSKIYPSIKTLDFLVNYSQAHLKRTGRPLLSEFFNMYSEVFFRLLQVIKDI
ncbi:MAG: NAD(P)/FAD-dependent oxidoreductase [Deltaproteobacteria bacterium]|nr:NAD(P)/FAD-dependent oxidoreductase [Deltaproteobacteria bacterium]MCB9478525.1 NAD(P)/FAD-dependent oxidoreductase [Deltaproteobacteria bacterium]